MQKLSQKLFVCVVLQGDCGEGCSQGLPGVPGMAGAKGEKGDIGKPGITPLDSCDKVRNWGLLGFGAFLYHSPYAESYVTPLIAQSLCLWLRSDECIVSGDPSLRVVLTFAWLDVRHYHADMIWCRR